MGELFEQGEVDVFYVLTGEAQEEERFCDSARTPASPVPESWEVISCYAEKLSNLIQLQYNNRL